eukprot:2174277-Alexandrium_andersonii.AAC.1
MGREQPPTSEGHPPRRRRRPAELHHQQGERDEPQARHKEHEGSRVQEGAPQLRRSRRRKES